MVCAYAGLALAGEPCTGPPPSGPTRARGVGLSAAYWADPAYAQKTCKVRYCDRIFKSDPCCRDLKLFLEWSVALLLEHIGELRDIVWLEYNPWRDQHLFRTQSLLDMIMVSIHDFFDIIIEVNLDGPRQLFALHFA